jgi:hypothetical protein
MMKLGCSWLVWDYLKLYLSFLSISLTAYVTGRPTGSAEIIIDCEIGFCFNEESEAG